MKRYTVKLGTKFRWNYADSNPLWEVIQARGKGTWIAEIVEGPDWLGQQKAFSSEEIKASLAETDFWKESRDESQNFYKSLKPGSVVHYSNGFSQYVRCQVMPGGKLCPIALVGDWRTYDLPHRLPDGSLSLGYHAQQIQKGELFQPHASNVWEFKGHPRRDDKDPTTMVPLDLTIPQMTKTQETLAELWQTVNRIRAVTHVDYTADPTKVLEAVKAIVA